MTSATTANTKPLSHSASETFSGAAHFWKGRVALYAILRSLGIGEGDAVIVPGYTCVVVPMAAHFVDAHPYYAEIDPDTYNTSLEHILQAAETAEAQGYPVRAVIVQHTYGNPCDVGPIFRWAEERNIWAIEDCCHASGGRYRDLSQGSDAQWQFLGSLGHAAFFSSQWSKPFTTGLGGWAVSRDPELQQKFHDFAEQHCQWPTSKETAVLRAQIVAHRALFRPSLFWFAQGTIRRLSKMGLMLGSSGNDELEIRKPADFAKRMSPMQERTALRRLQGLSNTVTHRRHLKELYDQQLQAAGLPVFEPPAYADPVLLRYPLRVADKHAALKEAKRRHVELGDWFDHPLHPEGLKVDALGWRDGLCPEGEKASAEVVNLPMHTRVKAKDVTKVVQLVREFCN